MRSPERLDELYDVLKKLHMNKYPDLRFYQFISMLMHTCEHDYKKDPFYMEDNQIVEFIKKFGEV